VFFFYSCHLHLEKILLPLPAARALNCICLWQDAAAIANGIALRALEQRLSQENGKKGSEGCARCLPGGARRLRHNSLAIARSAFGTYSVSSLHSSGTPFLLSFFPFFLLENPPTGRVYNKKRGIGKHPNGTREAAERTANEVSLNADSKTDKRTKTTQNLNTGKQSAPTERRTKGDT